MGRTALVGLGEGIGNVLMGLPLVDALTGAGRDVTVHLRTTPMTIVRDIADLIRAGRPSMRWCMDVDDLGQYDEACLTHWWLRQGDALPAASHMRIAPAIKYDRPEIEQNLDCLAGIIEPDDEWGRVNLHAFPSSIYAAGLDQLAVIHPGCKPEWYSKKLYPRWAEIVHRLKESGFATVIVGGKGDRDIYCGEPHSDLRGKLRLTETASVIATAKARNGCFISGDSGLHHMAVALGVPSIAIFGDSSTIKARHPNPSGPAPLILGPFPDREQFNALNPRNVARAATALIEADPACTEADTKVSK